MSAYSAGPRRPLTGPEGESRTRGTVSWLTRAILLVSCGVLGAAAGGAVVGFTSTTVGFDQLGEFIIGAAIGTGVAIMLGSVIIMRASRGAVAVTSGVALLLALLLVGALWLRIRAEASARPQPVPVTGSMEPVSPGL